MLIDGVSSGATVTCAANDTVIVRSVSTTQFKLSRIAYNGTATLTDTQTLTNKRVTPRILSAASYTTDTGTSLNIDNLDEFIVTAQAGALLFNNPTGTPTDGQELLIAVTGTAARALTYGTQFEASTVALPTTTVTTARLDMKFVWRADTSKWRIILATVAAAAAGGFTLGTAVATTSGTSVTFGSIPAGTKQIIISFQGVSLSGTESFVVQLGDAGGIETADYFSTSVTAIVGTATSGGSDTTGFFVYRSAGTQVASGHMTLTLLNPATFLWASSHTIKQSTSIVAVGGGDKALSAELTQLRLLAGGADTFDAGSVNIMYI